MLPEQISDLPDRVRIADKGGGYEVDILLDSEKDIRLVLVCNVRKMNLHIGKIDALSLAKHPAVFHPADDIGFRCLHDLHLDQAVVDQDPVPRFQILRKILISLRNHLAAAFHLPCCQRKSLAAFKFHAFSAFQSPGADFRSLGIEQNRDGFLFLPADLLQKIHPFLLLGICPVREIKACDIHAAVNDFSENLRIIRTGSHRAYDLGSFHILYPPHSVKAPPSAFPTYTAFSPADCALSCLPFFLF